MLRERIINKFLLRHQADRQSEIMPQEAPRLSNIDPLQTPDGRRKLANLRAAAANNPIV